jgi:hypothetical protein
MRLNLAGCPDEKGIIHVKRLGQKRPECGKNDKRQRPSLVKRQPARALFNSPLSECEVGTAISDVPSIPTSRAKKAGDESPPAENQKFRD